MSHWRLGGIIALYVLVVTLAVMVVVNRLNQVYVERQAKRELGMQKPAPEKIRIIRE